MKRMKTFGMYLLWFVLLYMFVTVSAYGYIEASYKRNRWNNNKRRQNANYNR